MSNQRLAKLLEMLEVEPNDTFLIYAIGMEHLGASDPITALTFFEKVLAIDANHIPSYYQIGKIYMEKGENFSSTAIPYFEKGLELAKAKGDLKTMNEFRSALDELLY